MRGFTDLKYYEGRYLINKKGEIYSLLSKKVLKPTTNNSGYQYVDLRKNMKTKRQFIHRLMGYTYLNLTKGLQINHKNKIRIDNRLANLEVVSRVNNELHKYRGKKRGVYWSKDRQVWHCYLWTGTYNKFLGRFKSKKKAYDTYYKAYLEKYGVKPW